MFQKWGFLMFRVRVKAVFEFYVHVYFQVFFNAVNLVQFQNSELQHIQITARFEPREWR